MQPYQTKVNKLPGTSYGEILPKARNIYAIEKKRTKRNPYVRSAYFKKDKVFLSSFWQHIFQKNPRDRKRRLQLYPCALELIRHSQIEPVSKENPNKRTEIIHRFAGLTPDKNIYFVQIKEVKKTHKKYFMSVFPAG